MNQPYPGQPSTLCIPFLSVALILIGANAASAQDRAVVENVILVTMDGLRFQELFGGADKRLIDKDDGGVEDVKITEAKYGDEDATARREKLMPFFWNVIAKGGQVFGSPEHNSKVLVENGRFFSYPGYNELLTGIADNSIWSNAKKPNKNVTVLEWFNQKPEFKGRVAAFCSWDVFPFIINERRSGVTVNAGWEPLETFENEAAKQSYNDLVNELPRTWKGVRYDTFTFRGAIESMKVDKPRLLYVALGETDDWAHTGRYDLYLDSAKGNDNFIRRLWEQAQSMNQYRNKTSLVIATDHGRGDGREGWKDHNPKLVGSERIWIAVMGPNVQPLGVRSDVSATQGQVAATVAHLLGHDFRAADERIAQPLPLDLPARSSE